MVELDAGVVVWDPSVFVVSVEPSLPVFVIEPSEFVFVVLLVPGVFEDDPSALLVVWLPSDPVEVLDWPDPLPLPEPEPESVALEAGVDPLSEPELGWLWVCLLLLPEPVAGVLV